MSVSASLYVGFVISPVGGGRKSVMHPAEPPSLQRPAAAAAGGSMLQAGPGRTVGGPQDRTRSTPPQSLSKVENAVTQG